MSKADFYSTFPRVPLSRSYRDYGYYNYAQAPRRAMRFLVQGNARKKAPTRFPSDYALPDALRGFCSETSYRQWLTRKANAHLIRDRKRWHSTASVKDYMIAIHSAVIDAGRYDYYTGEELDWGLVDKHSNEQSSAGWTSYKRMLAMMPMVNHAGDVPGDLDLRICSWRTDDAKSDLTLEEFVALCAKVVEHNIKIG